MSTSDLPRYFYEYWAGHAKGLPRFSRVLVDSIQGRVMTQVWMGHHGRFEDVHNDFLELDILRAAIIAKDADEAAEYEADAMEQAKDPDYFDVEF